MDPASRDCPACRVPPVLARLWPRFSEAISLTTNPDGADVYVLPYSARDEQWQYLGRTPLSAVHLPLGVFQFRIEEGWL